MKFLFVAPFYKPAYVYGGPTRSIPSLCEGLARRGNKVEVVTTNANGDSTLEVRVGKPVDVDGVKVTYYPQSTIAGRFFYSPALKQACFERADEFDFVYVYGIWNYPAIAAGSACRRQGVPYIVSPRTGLMRWPMRQGWYRKKLYLWLLGQRYLDGAWAMHYTTEVEKRESEQRKIDTPGFVVPNCMDFSEFDALPESGLFREEFGISVKAPLLLFLGRIEPRKGVEISLRAFAEAKRDTPEAQFVVAGPGDDEYVAQLREQADDLRIDDATHFPGYVDASERLRALVDADVFILTSHTENFAMAAVEAMAAGTPVLLSDEVGVAENAADAGAGVSVALDEREVTNELRHLLADPSLRNEMGAQGPPHVRETYRPDAVAPQMIEAIEELQGKKEAVY